MVYFTIPSAAQRVAVTCAHPGGALLLGLYLATSRCTLPPSGWKDI